MDKYNHKETEEKAKKRWQELGIEKLYQADDDSDREKKYILDMFPYPSADGLHTGHVESYTATDIISRYLRLCGYNVLHPQGFDAFGLPAENFAIKNKTHPAITTQRAIGNFRRQMDMMGLSYDWSRLVDTSSPDYYKWTQWFFLLLYKNGLAYKAKAKVNWCEHCQTVLANEQAEGGICERCRNPVIQKDLEQWFFRITDFLEDDGETAGLLSGLNKIDWPDSTKAAQKNWIGKSQGAIVKFSIFPSRGTSNFQFSNKPKTSISQNKTDFLEIFTTRLDTIFGCTFCIIAPEHPLINKLTPSIKNWAQVKKYIEEAKGKSDLQRISEMGEKTGVRLEGIKIINPFTHKEIPLFVSDFVLAQYGTGAVMAVPGHDQRDYEFARKYDLPIIEVIKSHDGISAIDKVAFTDDGVLINSDKFDGLTSEQAREKLTAWLEEKKQGHKTINYKIRDWLVSRQRYWGAPIPIIYCQDCKERRYNYVLLHGRHGSSQDDFFPWLKRELEILGHKVYCPDLPDTEDPKVSVQSDYVIENYNIDENTVIIGHSLGGTVALNLLEKTGQKVRKVVLVDSVIYPKFMDKKRPDLEKNFNWKFNFEKIKELSYEFIDIADKNFPIITPEQFIDKKKFLDTLLLYVKPEHNHFNSPIEPLILKQAIVDGMFTVPEKDLPVLLPDDVDFMPHGESPLVRSNKFHDIKCPKCGAKARRESDTMDTFVCSSWYYFRYADPHNKQEYASRDQINKWLPVDLYVGGAEHSVLHLLYSRFFTKVLHKLGYIDFDEPFLKLRHQGIILSEDGRKMSKSLGNVINPDDVVKEFGADALRMFEMFMGPLEDKKQWNTKGISGICRFLDKVLNLKLRIKNYELRITDDKVERLLHKTIKKVSADIENFKFNTAIAQMMIFINSSGEEKEISKEIFEKFIIILSPFAPHLAEAIWAELGHDKSIFTEPWPKYDETQTKDETIKFVVQVNGKLRDTFNVESDIDEAEARNLALESEKIKKWIDGKEIMKVIFVKGKLINIVIKN